MKETVFPRWQGALLGLCLLADGLYLPISGAAVRSAAAAGLTVFLLTLGWLAFLRKRNVDDFVTLCGRLGRAGTVLRVAAGGAAVIGVWNTLTRLTAFWQATALPGLPRLLTGGALLAVAALAARRRRIAVCMWAYPTAWLCGIIVLVSLLVTLPDCTWHNLLSLSQPPAYDRAAFFAPLGMLPVILLCQNRRSLPSTGAAVRGLAAGLIGLLFVALRALLILGAGASVLPYPIFSAAGVFSVGDFLQRGEVIFACALVLAECVRCAALLTLLWPNGSKKHVFTLPVPLSGEQSASS